MNCKIHTTNVDQLTEEQYALVRKNSFGASDIAVLFGVGFQTLDELIAIKAQDFVTQEELDIGKKPNVRKGKDLEDLILQKFKDKTGLKVKKPKDMYEIQEGWTVNFDGIISTGLYKGVPVEIKYVSSFAGKYWKEPDPEGYFAQKYSSKIEEHIKMAAYECGIPPYYYTQVQSQIYAAGKQWGYLCALFDKDWDIRIYQIQLDEFFIKNTKIRVHQAHQKLLLAKGKELPEIEIDPNFEF